MSARLELTILASNIKNFFNAREEENRRRLSRMNSQMKEEIHSIQNDYEKLRQSPSMLEEFIENARIQLLKEIEFYKNEAKVENNILEEENFEKYSMEIKNATSYEMIQEISSRVLQHYEEYLNQKEEKNQEEMIKEYILLKLNEMGRDVKIDEDGKILSTKDDSSMILEIMEDHIILDVPGKAKTCVKSIMEFEKNTKLELERKNLDWHTSEQEKEVKDRLQKLKKNPTLKQVYDVSLISKEK